MTSLSTLPTEALEDISVLLVAADVSRLWLTGDRNLRLKLSNGGISVLRLSWSHASIMPWPRFIQSIKSLRTLDWRSDLKNPYCPSLELTFVPPTLNRLCIHSTDVFCILNAMEYKLDALFPLLNHLDLRGKRIKAQNLKNLPKNLMSLSLASAGVQIADKTLFGDLPRSITDLRLRFTVIDEHEHGNDLPPNLQKISIGTLKCSYDWLKKVPQTVQTFRAGHMDQVTLESLPSQLQKLTITDPGDPSFVHLPETLTSLCMFFNDDAPVSFWSKLPSNIRSVTTNGIINDEVLQLLPKTITNLDVEIDPSHPDIISMFPPESTRMHITEMGVILNPLPLPPKLTFLQLPYMDDTICKILPQELRTLEIVVGKITAIGAKDIARLPLLRDLYVSVHAIIDEVVPYLRNIPTLTFGMTGEPAQQKLSIDFFRLLLPSSVDSNLPSRADGTTMRGPSSSHLNPLSEPVKGNFISKLSLSFKHPTMSECYLPQTVFPLFAHFSSLKSLSIVATQQYSIAPQIFQYFPPSLRSLSIHWLSSFPTPQNLDALPRGLAELSFKVYKASIIKTSSNCPWTDSDLSHLPRNLQSLNVNGKPIHLTLALNNYIPPYLEELIFDFIPAECFHSPLTRRFGKETV